MSLTATGSKDPCIAPAARLCLTDESPAVRVHCALIVANLEDSASLQAIIDMLSDDTPLVVSAAGRALTYLGARDPHSKGLAARALVKAWVKAKDPAKSSLLRALIEMSQRNYGTDEKEWATWAERLP
jgi:HEAT repeat protein